MKFLTFLILIISISLNARAEIIKEIILEKIDNQAESTSKYNLILILKRI